MKTGRGLIARVLTEAQWLGLDYIAKMSGLGVPWVYTCRNCTSSTARALADHGLVEFENRLMLGGKSKGKAVRRVRMKPAGRRMLKTGPPEGVVRRPGQYTWGRVGS
jgi:hypothetical protein